MNNIKRLSLALVALGLSAPAFANSTVLVPSQHGGFKVGIDALYLRANGSDLGYATSVVTAPTNFSLGLNRNAAVDPSYDWGVYAQVGYLFPCTGNDLTIGYTYLNSDNTDSVTAPSPVAGVSNVSIVVPPLSQLVNLLVSDGGNFAAAEGKSQFTLNVVDLEAGQRFTTGSYDLRMFAGLRYANIDATLKSFPHPFIRVVQPGVTTLADGSVVSDEQAFNSQFRGIGPRIGVDARYCLSSGFGLDADLSTSLLVGTVDSHYNAVTTNSFGSEFPRVETDRFASKNGSNTRVVPVLEAKLGADYTYILDCRCKSALVFEAGYQVTNYFNASEVHSSATRLSVDPNFADSIVLSGRATNDVAFDGPYLGVKYYA